MMNLWIYIIILAIIQGIAEFLPISSSGHLALLGTLFGLSEERSFSLGIALHAGSLLAILIFYFKLLLGFLKRDQLQLLIMIIIGTIPAGIGGVLLKTFKINEVLFGDPLLIGVCFLLTATLLRMSAKPKLIIRPKSEKDVPPTPLKKINPREALIVGITQMFAILPGISRSGSTITAGILCGIDREAAGIYSFLLAIPAIGGAVFLELLSMIRHGLPQGNEDTTVIQLIVGASLSAVVSYGALATLSKLIKRGKLSYFSYYLYLAGAAVILWRVSVILKG